MIKKVFLLFIISCLANICVAQFQNFPTGYEGIWEGELKVHKPANAEVISSPFKEPKMRMQLEISKNDTANCWNFIIRYISRDNPPEKRYLLKKDSFSGSYIFEELGYLKLYSYLMGNVLIERFSLPEKDITSIYKFSSDTIFTQIISSEVAPVTWTGGMKGSPKIFSYFIDGYQDAFLVRKKR